MVLCWGQTAKILKKNQFDFIKSILFWLDAAWTPTAENGKQSVYGSRQQYKKKKNYVIVLHNLFKFAMLMAINLRKFFCVCPWYFSLRAHSLIENLFFFSEEIENINCDYRSTEIF